MTNDNFKQILDEALKSVNKRLEEQSKGQKSLKIELAEVKDTI